jgi:hypothetical protein
VARGIRAILFLLVASLGAATAHAQDVCSETSRCLHTIGSPGRNASIGAHRMLFASGQLIWPSFIGVHALDLSTGQTRSLSHCGTAIGDIAIEGAFVYVLADHAQLCRVGLAPNSSVQMLVNRPDTVIEGFAVSSAGVAYSVRGRGEQPEMRVLQWNGTASAYPTAVTADRIAIDATNVYWIDAGALLKVSLATGAKTVGPRVANPVSRIAVDHGVVWVATDHEVMRLDGASWTTIAHEAADDLVADEGSVYWAGRNAIGKYKSGRVVTLAVANKPWALAIDATTLFVALDDPFVIQQIVPR